MPKYLTPEEIAALLFASRDNKPHTYHQTWGHKDLPITISLAVGMDSGKPGQWKIVGELFRSMLKNPDDWTAFKGYKERT